MTDTQALLSDLARVKALFQLRTIACVINGGIVVDDAEIDQAYARLTREQNGTGDSKPKGFQVANHGQPITQSGNNDHA